MTRLPTPRAARRAISVLLGGLMSALLSASPTAPRPEANVCAWKDGIAGAWSDAAAWSTGAPPAAGADVVIGAGAKVRLAAATPRLGHCTVKGTIEFTGAAAALVVSALTLAPGGALTQSGPVTTGQTPARISVECAGEIIVESGARIEADGRGFAGGVGHARNEDAESAGHGPGAGGFPKVWGASAGGSHGGRGGTPDAKAVYGSAAEPAEAGSGGGGGTGAGGGAGGGVIAIQAGKLCVEGLISAHGADGTPASYGAGGAGGSVRIRCATITGRGGVRADGGIGSRYAGGGGGGRIAVQCDPAAQRAVEREGWVQFSALGGVNGKAEFATVNPANFGWPGSLAFGPGPVPGLVLPNAGLVTGGNVAAPTANPTVAYWMPWLTSRPLGTIAKEIARKQPRRNAAALVQRCYVGPRLEMREVQAVEARDDVHTGRSLLFSADNGRTWSPPAPLADTVRMVGGIEVWEDGCACLYDPGAGVLVDVWLRQISLGNIWADGTCNCFTYYRLSRDGGRTWSEPRQLRYEPGADFDPAAPTKPEFLLRNQAYFGNNLIRHSNGTLITAVSHANAPDDPQNDRRAWKLGSLCFIGRWLPAKGDYEWTAGKRVTISADVSSRGLMEPSVAELKDGRVLVVWRGSNSATTPGRKWFSVSRDGGLTLTPPAEWKYDDGSSFYSPSSIHQFLRHSVTGKLYWFGNITPLPPAGNSPRYPLVMAEVDESIPALKKSTVTCIADRADNTDFNYQLSNFSLYENRETHLVELFLTTYGQEAGAENWSNADAWHYTLTLAPPGR